MTIVMYANEEFQLIAARTANVPVEMPWRRERPFMNPDAKFVRHGAVTNRPRHEQISAIIGKNGTGKSHLLCSIVKAFVALENAQLNDRKKLRNFPLEYLAYSVDGRRCEIEQCDKLGLTCKIGGSDVSLSQIPLPRRVIALTISPFDKFPAPRNLHARSDLAPKTIYRYLGLRDRFGKASIENLLYRSLTSLFEESENEALRRANIGAVFSFLNLEPKIRIIYRLRVSRAVREAILHGQQLKFREQFGYTQNRALEDLERAGISIDEVREQLKIAFDRAVGSRIEINVDFQSGGILDDLFFRLHALRKARLLSLSGVEVTHTSGLSSDLRSASSGQLSMVSALISLASAIDSGSLVLIDEPELSLHPEWQVKYVDLLSKTFARYKGCHFVVATHSPLVVSELPSHADVISLDKERLPSTEELSGQSSDYLLAEAFDFPTNGNLYVKNQIIEALRLVSAGKAKSSDFHVLLLELEKFAAVMPEDEPSKVIIDELRSVAEHAGKATLK